jgi:hypothetical protein
MECVHIVARKYCGQHVPRGWMQSECSAVRYDYSTHSLASWMAACNQCCDTPASRVTILYAVWVQCEQFGPVWVQCVFDVEESGQGFKSGLILNSWTVTHVCTCIYTQRLYIL